VKSTLRTTAALVVAGLVNSGALQAARPLTIQEIAGAPFPSQLRAAPKGNFVAWVSNERGARNVWVFERGAKINKARPLTAYTGDDGNEVTGLAWNGDGRSLFYTRGRCL
jgi:hypothetical protein